MGIINIIGGDLYQWDTGRSVEITPLKNFTIDEVHFMNPNGDNALVVEPVIDNNAVIARIPNILLQAAINIRVFVVMHTDDGERTISDCTFGVIARQKPEDYIYTETEVLNYSNLNRRLSDLENVKTSDGTVISQNAGYAEVGEWIDGNPDSEDRIGYFVEIDTDTSGTTMKKATSTSDVRGVTVSTPAFSGNCSDDKYDDNGNLLKQYSYVAVMGIVPVIDNGTCTVNGRCMPSDDGTAIPSDNNLGYHVIDRIDDIHILIAVEPGADMIQRIKNDIRSKQDILVSGKNIKTINNQPILGSGNIDIQGGGSGSAFPVFEIEWKTNPTTEDKTTIVSQFDAMAQIGGHRYIVRLKVGSDILDGVIYGKNKATFFDFGSGTAVPKVYTISASSVEAYNQTSEYFYNTILFDENSDIPASQAVITDYINGKLSTALGSVETALETLTTGGGVA